MAKIVLKNPYFEEEIKVKESRKLVADMLNWMQPQRQKRQRNLRWRYFEGYK